MAAHKAVTHEESRAARRKHLAEEKEFPRLRDPRSRERRGLPWEPVGKGSVFEGEGGRQTLADTFEGRTLLRLRDITMAAVSLAPYPKLAAYGKRMGWTFPRLSSAGRDFNFDDRVSFREDEPGAGKVDCNYRIESWSTSEGP